MITWEIEMACFEVLCFWYSVVVNNHCDVLCSIVGANILMDCKSENIKIADFGTSKRVQVTDQVLILYVHVYVML